MRDKTGSESDIQEEVELLRRRVADLSAAEKEREKTVKRLRDSVDLYRSLVDNSPVAVTVTDIEGNITHVSESTLKLYGYDRSEDLIGKSAYLLISPEDHDKARKNHERALDCGAVNDAKYTMLRKDGRTFVGDLSAGAVRNSQGEVYALVTMVRDITEQLGMESALRASEEKFRELVENTNDAMYRLGADGTIEYVSPAIESITGFSPSELMRHRITDHIHPDDISKVLGRIRNVLTGRLAPTEVRCITRAGEVRWVCVSSRPLYVDGIAVGMQGVLTDITDRKNAEQEVAFLASIIAKLKDSCIVTDLDYKIIYVNEATKEIFGYEKEELIGKTPDMFNAEPLAESVQKEIYETISAGGVWEAAIRNKKKDGSVFMNEFRVSPLYDENGNLKYYIGIQRDATEKKRLELELNQAQKMEAVGTMAGGIAHDFNNLLTAIIGYSELLLAACEPGSLMRRDVEEIGRTARRAALLTRRLLSFSKRQVTQLSPVDITTVVAGLDKMLRRLLSENIEFRADLDSGLPRVSADAGQIEQVVVNLVLNSRDAMEGGGTLKVRTGSVELADSDCHGRSDARPGNWVSLTVSDTGVGMEPEVVNHIFEPFYTTKDIGKGTGLGMSVVYGIVKAHKGWIEVKSEPSNGTEVVVYLPAMSELSDGEASRRVAALDLKGRGERVLLVEDQEEVRRLAERALRENGFDVFVAGGVSEALDVHDREKGGFDIVFSDVVLPDGSGLELAERIRSENPGTSILLTSGYTDQRLRWSVIERRKYGFLGKPYDLAELVRAVRKALNKVR